MLTLALDTTGQYSSAAIVSPGQILHSSILNIGRGHAEALAPQVERALKKTGVTPADITRIAVCTGPGSFSGVRVGLSFAKGFALPRQTPIIGMSALYSLARTADPAAQRTIMSIMDVRRGEVYWQIFRRGQAIGPAQLSGIDAALDAALDAADDTADYVGNGAHLIGKTAQHVRVNPAILGWLAQNKLPKTYPAKPLYHRPPDAKLPGGRILVKT